MHDLLNSAAAGGMLLFILASTVGNFALGVYLLFQFIVAPRRNVSRHPWAGFWGAGWVLLLCGLPTIFFGGFLLIVASTGLWAYAAWRCWQEQPKPIVPLVQKQPSESRQDSWPPPPTSAV